MTMSEDALRAIQATQGGLCRLHEALQRIETGMAHRLEATGSNPRKTSQANAAFAIDSAAAEVRESFDSLGESMRRREVGNTIAAIERMDAATDWLHAASEVHAGQTGGFMFPATTRANVRKVMDSWQLIRPGLEVLAKGVQS